jgi:hypothetical protein
LLKAAILALSLFTSLPSFSFAYSVLTHEAIVDTVWQGGIRPLLKSRFPDASDEQLSNAQAYTYGGSIIQDLGYYPFGSHLFSDLVHYVRSADFVQALLDEAHDVDELAFALGGIAHYGADVDGHSLAVNRAVPLLFPKLRRKFGNEVTYADDPSAHLKMEFGFDVLQVARGHYAPKSYHDFIGFQVSKDQLDRAFQKTYGLKLTDLFPALDLALGTYRFSVSHLLPDVTRAAWALKKKEIEQHEPTVSKKQFLYYIRKANYRNEWGATYRSPGAVTRFFVLLSRTLPKVGPLKGLAFRVPTPQAEKLFEDSFDASVKLDLDSFAQVEQGGLKIVNRDLDTGKLAKEGEYLFTDRTYDKLLVKLAKKNFATVNAELRDNILTFYTHMKTPDAHGIQRQLNALKAFDPTSLSTDDASRVSLQ